MENKEEYLTILNGFLQQMEELPPSLQPQVAEKISALCKALRISCFRISCYDSLRQEKDGDATVYHIYSDGEMEVAHCFRRREVTGGYQVIVYEAFGYKWQEEWTPSEWEKIEALVGLIYTYQGRNRLVILVDHFASYQQDSGLHNINYFRNQVDMLADAKRLINFGSCFFNIENMSLINQQVGRENGTVAMLRFVKQFEEMFDEDEVVAHIGGDNFVLLFYRDRFQKISKMLTGSVITYDDEQKLTVEMSAIAGFYVAQEPLKSGVDALDKTGAAYSAARSAKQQYVLWGDQILTQFQKMKIIQKNFQQSLEDEEYLVYYQPKVNLLNFKLIGAEALCRWKQGDKIVSPAHFIPILEQSNDICKLDFYILDHVCRDLREWLDQDKDVVKVSVNLSRKHLENPKLMDSILEIVDRYEIPHKLLEVEITETVSNEDYNDLKNFLSRLREEGFSSSVDDFGTGYSSLNMIKELPWNVVKLDKSLLEEKNHQSNRNHIMLKYVIAMAHELGLRCIAEGVETQEQVELLKQCDCHFAQGFYFWKPMSKSKYEDILEKK